MGIHANAFIMDPNNHVILGFEPPVVFPSPELDAKEARKLKRKQSNRESARRSRLRKQAEVEELQRRNVHLTIENSTLRREMETFRQSYFEAMTRVARYTEEISRL